MLQTPAAPAAGVPLRLAVPLPLFVNISPIGRAPVTLSVGVGTPDATNVYVAVAPTTKSLGLFVLGIVGAAGAGGAAAGWLDAPQPTSAKIRASRANEDAPDRI